MRRLCRQLSRWQFSLKLRETIRGAPVMHDDLSKQIQGSADRQLRLRGPHRVECVFPDGAHPGGFRLWWRPLNGSEENWTTRI